MLEMFRGDDATCNRCLARRKKNGQVIIQTKSGSRKYGEEHKEEKKAYNQE